MQRLSNIKAQYIYKKKNIFAPVHHDTCGDVDSICSIHKFYATWLAMQLYLT